MRVTIVRHARAGNKRDWAGPDALRPLDPVGEQHAIGLVPTLERLGVRRLFSSPAVRCVQTLEPFAVHAGLAIEITAILAPDADPKAFIARLNHPSLDGAALCTHGEVMRPLLRHVRRRGVPVAGPSGRDDGGGVLAKGTTWQLTISADGDIDELHHIPPDG